MKGYIYILKCSDNSYYTGSTKNLKLRLYQHQIGKGSNYTKNRLPVKLVYFEEYERIDEAFSREKQIQGWNKKKKQSLIKQNYKKLHNLAKCKNNSYFKRALSGVEGRTAEFSIPTKIIFGAQKIQSLKNILDPFCKKDTKILLCIGQKSAKKYQYLDLVKVALENYKIIIFEGIQPNPILEKVEDGLLLAKKNKINLIIALGGGSVMDTAKAIATAFANQITIKDLWQNPQQIKKQSTSLIMIPTTPATSSELNQFIVLTYQNIKKGFGLKPWMCPSLALIDPTLTLSLSYEDTKASIADILAHALESFWSNKSTFLSRDFSKKALKIIFEYASLCLNNLSNLHLRTKISEASLYAGFAFSHTGTTVCHSLSYPFTVFRKIVHGEACALTIPLFYKIFGKTGKLEEINEILEVKNSDEGSLKIEKFLNSINIKTCLSDFKIITKHLESILDYAFPYKNDVNPVKISKPEMFDYLNSII